MDTRTTAGTSTTSRKARAGRGRTSRRANPGGSLRALEKAITGQSMMNYQAIIEGFIAKGIEPDQIRPRENVFTYEAWRAVGRQVRRGEKGVSVVTFRECSKVDKETGEISAWRSPWHSTVFHISQTDPAVVPVAE